MQTRKNVNLAPENFRHSAVPRRLKHRARRRRRILCLLPVILVFGVLAAALLRFTPALAYADIFPAFRKRIPEYEVRLYVGGVRFHYDSLSAFKFLEGFPA